MKKVYLVKVGLAVSEEMWFKILTDDGWTTDGWTKDACIYYKLSFKPSA